MASSLGVSITADATQMLQAVASAKLAMQDLQTAIKAQAVDARSGGAAAQELGQKVKDLVGPYNTAAASVRELSAAQSAGRSASAAGAAGLEQVSTAAHHAGESSGVMREAIVSAHEAVMGEYTRLGSTLFVLAERAGIVEGAISVMSGGMVAAAAVVIGLAGALAVLIMREHEVAAAANAAGFAAVAQGRSGAAAQTATRALGDELHNTGLVGKVAANQITSAIEQLPGLLDDQRHKIETIAPFLYDQLGKDAEKTVSEIRRAFGSEDSLKRYLAEQDYLTIGVAEAWAGATTAGQRYTVGLDAVVARLGPVVAKTEAMRKAIQDAQDAQTRAAEMGVFLPSANVPPVPPGGMAAMEPGTTAPTAEQAAQTAAIVEGSKALKDQLDVTTSLKNAQAGLATAYQTGNAQVIEAATASIAYFTDKLHTMRMPGEAAWATQIQQQATAASDAAETTLEKSGAKKVQIEEGGAQAALAVWTRAANDQNASQEQRDLAASRAHDIHMSLIRDEVTGTSAAAKKSAEEVIAGYDEQIAAARGNISQIEAIETQKLAFIAATYGKASTEYQRALTEETSALRAAVQQQTQEIKTAGEQQISERKAELGLELAQHKITKSQELAAEIAFNDAVQADELKSMDAMIATLQRSTLAYTAAQKARHAADVQFQTQHLELLAQLQAADNSWAAKVGTSFMNVFREIGSSFNSTVEGLIARTTTWQQAEQTAAKAVLGGFLNLAEDLLSSWLKEMAEEEIANMSKNTIILAQDASWGAILGAFFKLTGLASGTSYVPQDMPAVLHQGEMVIPRYEADLIRGGGGAGHTFNYAPTINGGGADVAAQVRQTHEDFKGYMRNITRNGQIALPFRPQRAT